MNQPFQIQDPAYLNTDGIPMVWWGAIQAGKSYPRGAVVRDGQYTTIANKEGSQPPAAPVPTGPEQYLYEGASPTDQQTAKTVEYAQEFTAGRSGFITGYRLWVVNGNFYRVFTITEGDVLREIISFEANTDGWTEFDLVDTPILAGTTFAIYVVVAEPDPTPTTWQGDWSYFTPNNPAVPLGGQVVHANQAVSELRVSTQDANTGDRRAELAALTPGDIIESQGIRWSIQNIVDNGSWFNFAVAPAAQAPSDGVNTFVFETVTATPITFVKDVDYWINDDRVRGYENIDNAGGVWNQNAYGIDVKVQEASINPDWELVAYGGL